MEVQIIHMYLEIQRKLKVDLRLMKDVSKSFYLIETDGRQFFVTLTDSYIETRPLEQPLESSSFSIDGWNFIKYNYEL